MFGYKWYAYSVVKYYLPLCEKRVGMQLISNRMDLTLKMLEGLLSSRCLWEQTPYLERYGEGCVGHSVILLSLFI